MELPREVVGLTGLIYRTDTLLKALLKRLVYTCKYGTHIISSIYVNLGHIKYLANINLLYFDKDAKGPLTI